MHINNVDEVVSVNNSIVICDDMQVELKGNKVITEMSSFFLIILVPYRQNIETKMEIYFLSN